MKVWFCLSHVPKHELLGRVFMDLWKNKIQADRVELTTGTAGPALSEKEKDGLLVITDDAALASALRKENVAVLGYLHEKNKDAAFSGVDYLTEDLSGIDTDYCNLVYARAHGIAMQVLQTKRCIIREMKEEDLDRMYEIYADPAATAYMEPLFEDPDEERAYLKNYRERIYTFYGYGMWHILDKESGKMIGRAGLEPKEEGAELGYLIAAKYRGRGYATEVCRAILQYAFTELQLNLVRAVVHKENRASVALCRKLGFSLQSETENDFIYVLYG